MPTVNIYIAEANEDDSLSLLATQLRTLLARELSCDERTLAPNEISVRTILDCGAAMIAPIEIEIKAHSYAERLKRSDEICLLVRDFVRDQMPSAEDVRVWLMLADLGHSWDE